MKQHVLLKPSAALAVTGAAVGGFVASHADLGNPTVTGGVGG